MPMPGMGAPPGAPPPPPMGGAGGTGPAAHPGPLPGAAQQGKSAVMAGLESFQKALPQIPMGSKLHTALLKAVADISKHLEEEGGSGKDPSAMIQQLVELARNAKMNPNAAAALPQGGGGGAPPMPPAPNMGV